MSYQLFDMGAYNLHIINTKKFKTVTINACFRRKIVSEDVSKRIVLKEMLLNSNYNYKKEIDLIRETEDLYDLKLFASSSRIGNYTNLSFKTRFLNEKYTEKGMNVESIIFFLDTLFKPNVSNNSFNDEVLSQIKSRIIKDIQTLKDNKLKYAIFSLMEQFKDKPYSYSSYGRVEDIEKITAKNLYEYYLDVLNNDLVDIFVVGDVEVKKVKEIFKDNFRLRTFHKREDNIIVPELPSRGRVKKVVLEDDANQSQVLLLYSLHNLTDYERKYVLLIYNELLGGSASSILFNNIREKNSYAYYINSLAKAYDNFLLIYSGVEPSNEEIVFKLIRKNIENISKGKWDNNYLTSAKEILISSVTASVDSPLGIINTYLAKVLVGSADADERIEQIKKVSYEDVINLSKKIKIHTTFLLKGASNGNKD